MLTLSQDHLTLLNGEFLCPGIVRLLNHPDRRSLQRVYPLRSERQVMVRQPQDQPQGPIARRVDPETAQEVSRSIRYTRG